MENFTGTNYSDMSRIYLYNNLIRARLLNRTKSLDNDIDKIKHIVNYFTNNLPIEEIAEIDSVSPREVTEFKYDYSFIKANETPFNRQPMMINYPQGRASTIACCDVDVEIPGKPRISPTIFALKAGTCTIFANEIKRLMANLGIECKIVYTPTPVSCYDYFNGYDEHYNKINVNTIKKIYHAYNVITIDGKDYKIDIAGYLTAQDFNKNHPLGKQYPIDVNRFIFSEDLSSNPFEEMEEYLGNN